MNRQRTVDPGGEICNAPRGSEDWAKRVRLELISMVNHVHFEPQNVSEYIDLVQRERVWTLLTDRWGTPFRTFDDFCEEIQPWGLGRPFSQIRPYLEAVHGKKGLALATVAPSGQGERTDLTSDTGDRKWDNAKENRLRAILRAPEYVQELYRQDLISQKVAAKLGPKTEVKDADRRKVLIEKKRQAEDVVENLRTFIDPQSKVKSEKDKPVVRKLVDKQVLRMLGQQPEDAVAKLVRQILALPPEQRKRVIDAVKDAQ